MLGLIALPQMLRLGHNRALAIDTVCAGGSLGDLFLATVTPGLILASFHVIYVLVRCYMDPGMGPPISQEELDIPMSEKLAEIRGVILPVGVASVTEAAAMGVVGAFLAALVRRELTWALIRDSLKQTLESCGMIIWIGLGAAALVGVHNLMGGNRFIESTILDSGASPLVIVLMMMGILVVLGLFMNWIGIALLIMPIFVPIISKLDIDPVWFGILFGIDMQFS